LSAIRKKKEPSPVAGFEPPLIDFLSLAGRIEKGFLHGGTRPKFVSGGANPATSRGKSASLGEAKFRVAGRESVSDVCPGTDANEILETKFEQEGEP